MWIEVSDSEEEKTVRWISALIEIQSLDRKIETQEINSKDACQTGPFRERDRERGGEREREREGEREREREGERERERERERLQAVSVSNACARVATTHKRGNGRQQLSLFITICGQIITQAQGLTANTWPSETESPHPPHAESVSVAGD